MNRAALRGWIPHEFIGHETQAPSHGACMARPGIHQHGELVQGPARVSEPRRPTSRWQTKQSLAHASLWQVWVPDPNHGTQVEGAAGARSPDLPISGRLPAPSWQRMMAPGSEPGGAAQWRQQLLRLVAALHGPVEGDGMAEGGSRAETGATAKARWWR